MLRTKDKYFKSPMNYLGNKYKLLPQITELLPNSIDNFYDLFCGGLDVALNVNANNIIVNDKHEDLIWLYSEIKEYKGHLGDDLLALDKKTFPMNTYKNKALRSYDNAKEKDIWRHLMSKKRDAFYKAREELNSNIHKDFKVLMLLMLNSIGAIEFRVVNRYTTFTCGSNRVNERIKENLNVFKNKINKLEFMNEDFRYITKINLNKNDFVYLDPPYLGTSQYKVKWKEDDEKDLYNLLDDLNSRGIKFALSNFKDGENHTNEYLSKWCGNYNIHNLRDNHSNLSGIRKNNGLKRQEILITNY